MRTKWGDFPVPSILVRLVVIKTDPHVGGGGRWREQLRNLASCQFFVFFVIPMVGRDGGAREQDKEHPGLGGINF